MRIRTARLLALLGGLVLFLVFGLAWISRPGLLQDEMLFLNAAFPDNPIIHFVGGMWIFKHKVPLMLMPYLGAAKGLLWRLVFYFWAPSVYSARVPVVLLGALTLVLFYFWARRYYSAGVAALAVLLAGADPGYIFTARLDWGPVVLQRLLAVAGLLLAARWIESGDRAPQSEIAAGAGWGAAPISANASAGGTAAAPALEIIPAALALASAIARALVTVRSQPRALAWLAGAGFCFGLGLWDKSSFAWFLTALGISLVVLFPRDVLRRVHPAPIAVFILALLIGAYPLVRFNLSKGGGNTAGAVHLDLRPSEIADKVSNLWLSLDGRFVQNWVAGSAFNPAETEAHADRTGRFLATVSRAAPPWGTFFPPALVLALLAAYLARGVRRPLLFPLLLSALMWIQVLPLKEGGGAHHFVLAFPFPHLAIAAAAAFAWQRLRGMWRFVPLVIVSAVIVTMIGWDARGVWAFRETGGAGNWSNASGDLAVYLEKRHTQTVMCMDWGFSYPLLLLSQGRLNEQDFYAEVAFTRQEDYPKHVQKLVPLLFQPDALYVFHVGGYQLFPRVRSVFEEALKRSGLQEKVVATFKQQKRDDLIVVSEVVPSPELGVLANEKLDLRIAPGLVASGGQYTLECPQLPGKTIDLLYVTGKAESADIASAFAHLDSSGRAVIPVPQAIPSGKVDVIAVRETGTTAWRPAAASIVVK